MLADGRGGGQPVIARQHAVRPVEPMTLIEGEDAGHRAASAAGVAGDTTGHLEGVLPGQSQALSFQAPNEPGIYPYVCTYPGHWRRMYGALYVVKDLSEYQANPQAYLAKSQQTPSRTRSGRWGRLSCASTAMERL